MIIKERVLRTSEQKRFQARFLFFFFKSGLSFEETLPSKISYISRSVLINLGVERSCVIIPLSLVYTRIYIYIYREERGGNEEWNDVEVLTR